MAVIRVFTPFSGLAYVVSDRARQLTPPMGLYCQHAKVLGCETWEMHVRDTMKSEQARPGTLSVIIQTANPVFILLAMGIPIGLLTYALIAGSVVSINFVHIMMGALWTGADLFYGFVLGPILGKMEPENRVAVFRRLVPRMTFLMPALATVTMVSGLILTRQLGYPLDSPRIIVAIVIVSLLSIQGFGILLPNEIRVYQQLLSKRPDIDKISRLGMMNARLGGFQGLLQVAIIVDMAIIRF